jgi:hypothetical protein
MNPKSLVAPDQDAAAVSAHADASIASITTVANSPLWPAPLSRPAGSDVELPPLNRRASAVARNCRPPEEELSYGDPRFARPYCNRVISAQQEPASRRRLQVIVALALEPAIRP